MERTLGQIQQVNLYPQEMRPRKDRLSRPYLAGYGIIFMTLLIVVYGWHLSSLQQAKGELDRIVEKKEKMLLELKNASQNKKQRELNKALEAKVYQQEQLHLKKVFLIEILEADRYPERVGRNYYTQGYSRFLEGLIGQPVSGLSLNEIEIVGGGDRIAVSGMVEEVDLLLKYLERLQGHVDFAGKGFNVFRLSQSKTDNQALHFLLATKQELLR